MAFGTHIKKLREDCKMSAQALANKLDVRAERLRKWEQFDRDPKAEDLFKIEQIFSMSLQEIMFLNEMPDFIKKLDPKGSIHKDEAKTILHKLIVMEAKINVLFSHEAEKVAKTTSKKATEVLREMYAAVRLETDNLIEELKRKTVACFPVVIAFL